MHKTYATREAAEERAHALADQHRIAFGVWWREEDDRFLVMPEGWEPMSIRYWRREKMVAPEHN